MSSSARVTVHAEPDITVRDFTETKPPFATIEIGDVVTIIINDLATVTALETAIAEARAIIAAFE